MASPTPTRGFGSDNHCGALPEVLEALAQASAGHAPSYGTDSWSLRAQELLQGLFGPQSTSFFVFNGTAANVLALRALVASYNSVLCTSVSHLNVDECGAPEVVGGYKLIPIVAPNGKLTPELLAPHVVRRGDQHFAQPGAISITQPTELGTLYTLEELAAIVEFARANDLGIHMDGARLVNAAAALECSLGDLTRGIDVLSFGGTKNGLVFGEAVVFIGPRGTEGFKFLRKQCMQLPSKSRFIAAQFCAWLSDGLWLRSACHENTRAKELEAAVASVAGVELLYPVAANSVFARIPRAWLKPLRQQFFFYVWNSNPAPEKFDVRWMTSFDTTEEDVAQFAAALRSM